MANKFLSQFEELQRTEEENRFLSQFDEVAETGETPQEQKKVEIQPPAITQPAEDYDTTGIPGVDVGDTGEGFAKTRGIAGGAAKTGLGLAGYMVGLGAKSSMRMAESEGVDEIVPGVEQPLTTKEPFGAGDPAEFEYETIDSLGMPVATGIKKEARFEGDINPTIAANEKAIDEVIAGIVENTGNFIRDFPAYLRDGDDWRPPTETAIEVQMEKETSTIVNIPMEGMLFFPKMIGDGVADQTGSRTAGDIAEYAAFGGIHKATVGVKSAPRAFKDWWWEKRLNLSKENRFKVAQTITEMRAAQIEIKEFNHTRSEPLASGGSKEFYTNTITGEEIHVFKPRGIDELLHIRNVQRAARVYKGKHRARINSKKREIARQQEAKEVTEAKEERVDVTPKESPKPIEPAKAVTKEQKKLTKEQEGNFSQAEIDELNAVLAEAVDAEITAQEVKDNLGEGTPPQSREVAPGAEKKKKPYFAKGRRVYDGTGRMVAEGSPDMPFTKREAWQYAKRLNEAEGLVRPKAEKPTKPIGKGKHKPPKGVKERRSKERRTRSEFSELQVPNMDVLRNDLEVVRESLRFREQERHSLREKWKNAKPEDRRALELEGMELNEAINTYKESERLLLERQAEILQGKPPRSVEVKAAKGRDVEKTAAQKVFEQGRAERGAVPRSSEAKKDLPPKAEKPAGKPKAKKGDIRQKDGKTYQHDGKRWREIKKTITKERAKKVAEVEAEPTKVRSAPLREAGGDKIIYPDSEGNFSDGSRVRAALVTPDGQVLYGEVPHIELTRNMDPQMKDVYQKTSADSMGYADVDGRFVSFNELKEVGNDFRKAFEKKYGPEAKRGLIEKTSPETPAILTEADAFESISKLDVSFNSEFYWQAEIGGKQYDIVKEKGHSGAEIYVDGVRVNRLDNAKAINAFMERMFSQAGSSIIIGSIAKQTKKLMGRAYRRYAEGGEFSHLVNPAHKRSIESIRQQGIMREHIARADRELEALTELFEKTRKQTRRWSRDETLAFTDALEIPNNLHSLTDPNVRMLAEAFKKLMQENWREVVRLGGSDVWLEEFFPHYWDIPEDLIAVHTQRRPLRGPRKFQNKRKFKTFREGVEYFENNPLPDGRIIRPLSWDVTELFLWKMRETRRYIAGVNMWNEMRLMTDVPLVKYVPNKPGAKPPPGGWIPLEDSVARAYSLDKTGLLVERGQYYAHPDAARIFNNHLSPGLHGRSRTYDFFRALNNDMTMLQLSFSAFHFVFVTGDALAQKFTHTMEALSEGKFREAVKSGAITLTGVGPVIEYGLKGRALREKFLQSSEALTELRSASGGSAMPAEDMAAAAAVVEGGGGLSKGLYYDMKSLSRFRTNLKNKKYARAAGNLMKRVPEYWTEVIMDNVVTPAKFAIFNEQRMAYIERMRRKGYEPTLQERRIAYAKMWDRVDNRLGMLRYNNLFWNNMFKDGMLMLVRAVGWNVGTIREVGKGIVEAPLGTAKRIKTLGEYLWKDPKERAKMKEKFYKEGGTNLDLVIDPSTMYVLSLAVTTVLSTMALETLVYGQPLSGRWDDERSFLENVFRNFQIKTGRKLSDGSDEYIMLPGYLRDVVSVSHSGLLTGALHKISPFWQMLHDIATNRRFDGSMVHYKDAKEDYISDLPHRVYDYGKEMVYTSVPFSWKNTELRNRQSEDGDWLSWRTFESATGLTVPAPKASTRSKAVNFANEERGRMAPGGPFTPEEMERKDKLHQMRKMGHRGDTKAEIRAYARENGVDMATARRILKESRQDPLMRAALTVPTNSIEGFISLLTPSEAKHVRKKLRGRINRIRIFDMDKKRELKLQLDAKAGEAK